MEASPSPPQSILSLIAESPADVGYWSDERRVGGKSGVLLRIFIKVTYQQRRHRFYSMNYPNLPSTVVRVSVS